MNNEQEQDKPTRNVNNDGFHDHYITDVCKVWAISGRTTLIVTLKQNVAKVLKAKPGSILEVKFKKIQ